MTYDAPESAPLTPRSYQPVAGILHQVYATMLASHPEAFDCIIYPAKGSEHNEILADNEPVATLLDRDERAQEYDPPVAGRALIIPSQELRFEATDSGIAESFHTATEVITLLLSEQGLRKHSLVQWREYVFCDADDLVERVVYVADVKPLGRTLNAQMAYVCYPLPAMGEKPEDENAPDGGDTGGDNGPVVGVI